MTEHIAHTPAEIHEQLRITPEGKLFWRVPKRGRRLYCEVGCLNNAGYLVVRLDGILYLAHRLAWVLYYNEWPTNVIDHINGIETDNRKENLRDVTRSINCSNRHTAKNKLGFLNIHETSKGNYQVGFQRNSKPIHVGTYETLQEALEARAKFKAANPLT
jgi:hypothetical protein